MANQNQTRGEAANGKLTRASAPVEVTADHSSSSVSAPITVSQPELRLPEGSNRYQIIDEIARGGMGIIYRATDTALGREVAVKMLSEHYALESGGARRFADEARITAQLQHPGIPPVHDLGVLPNGRPFLAMKLIKGQTLSDLLQRRPDPSAERGRFVAIFEQTCQAVAYAHAHQVVHRDLKPANVMVGSFGEVQVMDWGLAKVLVSAFDSDADAQTNQSSDATVIRGSDSGGRDASLTQMGSVLGTLPYMPPEQAAGEINKVGATSDVFGLGAILAVILTGEPPYSGSDFEAVRVMAIRGDLKNCLARLETCGAEAGLVSLCQRCLAFDPEIRPQDAGALAREVAQLRTASEERARAAEQERAAAEVKLADQKAKRRWQRTVAVAIVLILALIGGGSWWLDRQNSQREKERAVEAERNLREAAAALSQAEESLSDGDLEAVDLALMLGQERLGQNGPPGLAKRLFMATKDRDFLRDLRGIEDLTYLPGAMGSPLPAEMSQSYQELFAQYGLDVGAIEPEVAAEAVRKSRISSALLSTLGEWFCIDPKFAHLCELLDQLDQNADRAEIRNALLAGDESRVRAMVSALDGSKTPAWFASSVGFHPIVPKEEGVRIMSAAWRTHPSDFMLAYRCFWRLWGTQRIDEMLTWAKVAVALQPERPAAHSALASAWQAKGNWEEAEASARRSIEVGRHHPTHSGPVVLGNVLLEKGDLAGAEANYLAALKIKPQAGTYFSLGVVGERRKDILEAEKWYRKAADTAPEGYPNRAFFRKVSDETSQALAFQEKVANGELDPPDPNTALAVIRLTRHPSKCQYTRAVALFEWVFEKDAAMASDLDRGLRQDGAVCALMAAAGKDKGEPNVEPTERRRLLGLSMNWLRADLALMRELVNDSQWRDKIHKWLTKWKEEKDFEPIRSAESLLNMESDDRTAWNELWRDVDAVLAASDSPSSTAGVGIPREQ